MTADSVALKTAGSAGQSMHVLLGGLTATVLAGCVALGAFREESACLSSFRGPAPLVLGPAPRGLGPLVVS